MAHDSFPSQCWSRTPYYRPGGKLSAEQLNAGQADALKRDRLVNMAMHGVGVAFGYEVRTGAHGHIVIEDGCIHIGCGLAFDRYGRMLFWRGGWLSFGDIVGCRPERGGRYTLRLHYAETSESGDAFDPCREGSDWVDRCVAFTLEAWCEPWNGCPPEPPCDACMTRGEWICARNGTHQGAVPMDAQLAYACAEIPDLAASDCGRVAYDPDAGLPLSCIEICDLDQDKEDCDQRLGFCPCTPVESCRIRPVAYRNPLLRELIDGADMRPAKIESYSWADWRMDCWDDRHRVPFKAFKQRAMACQPDCPTDHEKGFWVKFTCPVQRCTLHPLSVLMEIYIRENRPHYWKPLRIPIEVRHLDENGEVLAEDADDECARGLLICPLGDWIRYELEDENSTILDCANRGQLARVEITLRGQIIRDCCGLMIDARPPDIDADDTCGNRAGQARPGGDWISVFRVGPDGPPGHGYDDRDDAGEGPGDADYSQEQR